MMWDRITSIANIHDAAERAAKGKHSRADVALFRANLEPEVLALRRELLGHSYQPGPYRTFRITDPKPRLISAAPFRDRVVHHVFTNVVEPVFERRFVPYSFACRAGLGTHAALAHARQACAKFAFVFKADVRRYFPSIDHLILKSRLASVLDCPDTLWLAHRIIDSSNPQEESVFYYPGDDLFTPFERPRGLPLGNQTSQFFANVYLDPLDQMIARNLRPGAYARYVDDLLLFADSREDLEAMHRETESYLLRLRLTLHLRKSRVYRCEDGFPFLGFRLFPDHARLVRANVVHFRRRLKALREDYYAGRADMDSVKQSVRAWIGHAMHGDTWRLREQIFEAFPFLAGIREPRP